MLSDGENDSNTGKTSEEVKSALKDANIPVYAFMNKMRRQRMGMPWKELQHQAVAKVFTLRTMIFKQRGNENQ